MKKSIIALVAAVALLPTVAFAADIGAGIAAVNMSSFSGGAVAGGNIGAAGLVGPSSVSSTFTQSAHNEGLAGTLAKIERPANTAGITMSIVSEHSVTGWTQQSQVGSANGLAGQVNLSAGIQGGLALSSGQLQGALGYGFLNF